MAVGRGPRACHSVGKRGVKATAKNRDQRLLVDTRQLLSVGLELAVGRREVSVNHAKLVELG